MDGRRDGRTEEGGRAGGLLPGPADPPLTRAGEPAVALMQPCFGVTLLVLAPPLMFLLSSHHVNCGAGVRGMAG